MDNNRIGNIIREARKAKNMTQKDLADLLHITDRAVSKWERGLCLPDISLFEPISEILDISVTDLIPGKQHIEPDVDIPIEKEVRLPKKTEPNHKILITVLFIISLLPMLLNQYGGMRGVQEISGLINLLNPIGIASVVLFIVGVWIKFKNIKFSRLLGLLGTIGIVISEIFKFFTWHVMNITGEISIQNSLQFAFFEFYLGLTVSILMVIAYLVCLKKGNA